MAIYKKMKQTKGNLEKLGNIQETVRKGSHILIFASLTTISNLFTWTPLCIISLLTTVGYNLPYTAINTVVIIALPINSLANPFLYTIATKQFKEKLQSNIKEKLQSIRLQRNDV